MRKTTKAALMPRSDPGRPLMLYLFFNLAMITCQVLIAGLRGFHETGSMPGIEIWVMILIISVGFYAFYLLVPANIAFAAGTGLKTALLAAAGLAAWAVAMGFGQVYLASLNSLTVGGQILVENGVPQPAYHMRNVLSVLASYFPAAWLTWWLFPGRHTQGGP